MVDEAQILGHIQELGAVIHSEKGGSVRAVEWLIDRLDAAGRIASGAVEEAAAECAMDADDHEEAGARAAEAGIDAALEHAGAWAAAMLTEARFSAALRCTRATQGVGVDGWPAYLMALSPGTAYPLMYARDCALLWTGA